MHNRPHQWNKGPKRASSQASSHVEPHVCQATCRATRRATSSHTSSHVDPARTFRRMTAARKLTLPNAPNLSAKPHVTPTKLFKLNANDPIATFSSEIAPQCGKTCRTWQFSMCFARKRKNFKCFSWFSHKGLFKTNILILTPRRVWGGDSVSLQSAKPVQILHQA